MIILWSDGTGGYAVLEWFGGHVPDSGNVLIGSSKPMACTEIVDDTADER